MYHTTIRTEADRIFYRMGATTVVPASVRQRGWSSRGDRNRREASFPRHQRSFDALTVEVHDIQIIQDHPVIVVRCFSAVDVRVCIQGSFCKYTYYMHITYGQKETHSQVGNSDTLIIFNRIEWANIVSSFENFSAVLWISKPMPRKKKKTSRRTSGQMVKP